MPLLGGVLLALAALPRVHALPGPTDAPADAAESALMPLAGGLAAPPSRVNRAAADIASRLTQLDPVEQQQVLGALACGTLGGGDTVLRAACAAAAPAVLPASFAADVAPSSPSLLSLLTGAVIGGGSGPHGRLLAGSDPSCPYKSTEVTAVNREHIELMVIAVVIITVLIEVGTHWIDHATEKHDHIFQIVQRVYKELMLLGIISFGLFFFESSACLAPAVTHELHVIHILVFFISIAYIAEAFFILYVAALVARRWNKLERITLVQYAGLKLHLAALTEKLESRKWYEIVFYPSSWLLMYRQHSTRAAAAYQDARLQFVSCNRLPHDFCFNVYLRKCIRQVFVDLIHIHCALLPPPGQAGRSTPVRPVSLPPPFPISASLSAPATASHQVPILPPPFPPC